MAVLWNESTDGDFWNDTSSSTALGPLGLGDNTVTGALPESPVDNLDRFSFSVPAGLVLESIVVTDLDTTGFSNGFNLFLVGGEVGVVGRNGRHQTRRPAREVVVPTPRRDDGPGTGDQVGHREQRHHDSTPSRNLHARLTIQRP